MVGEVWKTGRWLGPALALAAALWVGFDVWIGLDGDDAENLETTRVLAAARQWMEGPEALYGPFSAANPAVLIQAPLYYRLTGLGAAPFLWLGLQPFAACLMAGRLISLVSFVVLLGLAWALARQGGAPSRVGLWAALLVAGSPLVGSFPVAMRPDLLGVAFQTGGLLEVARLLFRPPAAWDRGRLVGAFLLFGLAILTKQHLIGGPALALVGLARHRRDLLRPARLGLALGVTGVMMFAYFGCEQIITRGEMGRSVFILPGELKRVTAGSWAYAGLVFQEALRRGLGLVALGVAVVWAGSGRVARGSFERWLTLGVGLELGLMALLCRSSSGGWFNYALPALIGGAVLAARGLDEVLKRPGTTRLAAVGAAVLLLVAVDGRLVTKGVRQRLDVQAERAQLRADARVAAVPSEGRYFAGTYQHYNRLLGRLELTHDEWLYRAFEAIDAAEPRDRWLREALTEGPVKLVVVDRDAGPRVAGVDGPLTTLGFEDAGRVGRFALWRRR